MTYNQRFALVIRPFDPDRFVARRLVPLTLDALLQPALVVQHEAMLNDIARLALENWAQEAIGGIEAAVEEDRGDQGLERIGQQRVAVAAAALLLALAELERLAEAKLPREAGQHRRTDERRTKGS